MTVYNLSPRQITRGEQILAVTRDRGLPDKAAEYAIACSGAEASLVNWANAGTSQHTAKGGKISGRQLNAAERAETRRSMGSEFSDGTPPWGDNLDSCGLFAQRWIEGWCGGDVMAIMVPTRSTGAFLDALLRVKGWETRPAGEVIRAVQGYYSDIYSDWLATARAFVATRPPGEPIEPVPVPPTPAALPAGMIVSRVAGVDWAWTDDFSLLLRIPSEAYYRNLEYLGVIAVGHGKAPEIAQELLDWLAGQTTAAGGSVWTPAE